MTDLEEAVTQVAKRAARLRWNMPTWSGFDITIKRIEQIDDVPATLQVEA